MTDLLGWVASIIMLIGSYWVAYKSRLGLILFMVGNIIWAGIGVSTGITSLFGVSIAFIIMDIYAYWKWTIDLTAAKKHGIL